MLAVINTRMSREMYIVKLDDRVARFKLFDLISGQEHNSFKKDITRINAGSENRNNQIECDILISKIEKSIYSLTENEYWFLYFFLKGEYFDNGNQDSTLGFDLTYGLYTKQEIDYFGNYLWQYDRKKKSECELKFMKPLMANDFRTFINFCICYSGELQLLFDKFDYIDNSSEIRKQIDKIRAGQDKISYNLAMTVYEENLVYNIETIRLLPDLQKFREANKDLNEYDYPTEFKDLLKRDNDLWYYSDLYRHFTFIKEEIESFEGQILMILDQ